MESMWLMYPIRLMSHQMKQKRKTFCLNSSFPSFVVGKGMGGGRGRGAGLKCVTCMEGNGKANKAIARTVIKKLLPFLMSRAPFIGIGSTVIMYTICSLKRERVPLCRTVENKNPSNWWDKWPHEPNMRCGISWNWRRWRNVSIAFQRHPE